MAAQTTSFLSSLWLRPLEMLSPLPEPVAGPSKRPSIADVSRRHLSADQIEVALPPASPSLPLCSMRVAFEETETGAEVAPAFYPGQAIPTVLTFDLNRYASLPLDLNPRLNMSLIGTLRQPNGKSRTIINVSVSLEEGLELWKRDAQQAYSERYHGKTTALTFLPGGTYSLPLTVQVPTTPCLPPSFNVSGATFAVSYGLVVTLSCLQTADSDMRVNLAEIARPFEMIPSTSPTRTPRYSETPFSVRGRTETSKWTVVPHLPTTAFSPTSRIPIALDLTPPEDYTDSYKVLVHIALTRREHSATSEAVLNDPTGRTGLVKEDCLVSTMAWFKVPRDTLRVATILPIMVDNTWSNGYTTVLKVGPSPSEQSIETLAVSSTFQITTTLAFLAEERSATLHDLLPVIPPQGVFTTPQSGSTIDMASFRAAFPGTVRVLPLPITIGSVSEPRLAMHTVRWSDLHLDQTSGEEVGQLVHGETVSCEAGWIQAPPSYIEALQSAPYVY